MIETGSRLGSYEIQGQLGAGGMGVVYRAFDTALQRPVAFKTLSHVGPDARASLLREARAASALNHPHICTIYEVGEHEGLPFIAMEYVDGQRLRDLIPGRGLPAESVVEYGAQIAAAVERAHRHGIVHRDLKSANVIVTREGQVKVLDFGLASRVAAADMETLTRTRTLDPGAGSMAGTLPYLAPELLCGGGADKRTDVWALGVLLYEMAAGQLPFRGSSELEITAAILDGRPRPLPSKDPGRLQAIIGRCLARDPIQRYQHGGELRVALETLKLGTAPALLTRDEAPAPNRGSPWKGRLLIAGIVALGLVVASAAVVRATRANALTERDTLLIADFVNTTGDNVFDGTLKQALSIDLEQSPFLSIVSRDQARDALRLMTKSPDERVAGDVAREVCQRAGGKALIEGSIAQLGSHYALGLEAVNCQSGETIASEQADAAGREEVLKALGAAASHLRPKLGESLQTIQRFDTPIEQATTASFEALKAFSIGEDIRARAGELDAVPFYKHAIELDPDFATAYARLSTVYGDVGQVAEMRRNTQEAYARRAHASERERFYIDGRHCILTPDPDCYANVHELWKRTYPRDPIPYGNLCATYTFNGMFEKAVENGEIALRLDQAHALGYVVLARAYLGLGRPQDAARTIDEAIARRLEHPAVRIYKYRVAFLNRDERVMAAVRQWFVGRPEESLFAELESDAAAFDGRMRRSRELRARAEQLGAAHLDERILTARAQGALWDAAQGDSDRAREAVKAIAPGSWPPSTNPILIAIAVLAHDYQRADALFQERDRSASTGAPGLLQSLVRILRGIDAGDRSVIDRLPAATPRELAPPERFRPVYVRGLIYLHAGDGANAAVQFQRILDHRGVDATGPLYPLAYLQQGRAYALSGDQAKARKAYEDFFALWKDADPDVPILQEAKTEYARLTGSQGGGRQP